MPGFPLARIIAMEWPDDGIRVNTVHSNTVFDTGICNDEILKARAKHYGISIEEYKRGNLFSTEVNSQHVAEMCGPLFAKTTGVQLPVDGGNELVN